MLGHHDDYQAFSRQLIGSGFSVPERSGQAASGTGDYRLSVVPRRHPARTRTQGASSSGSRARGHHLRLLRAIPNDLIGEDARRLRDAEEIALPDVADNIRIWRGGLVGARMTHEELLRLPTPRSSTCSIRWRTDMHEEAIIATCGSTSLDQVGSSKRHESSVFLPRATPLGCSESWTNSLWNGTDWLRGEVLRGLAESTLPTPRLVEFIEQLDDRGCRSHDFREGAANAVAARASPEQPIDIGFLRRWSPGLRRLLNRLSGGTPRTCPTTTNGKQHFVQSRRLVMLMQGRGSMIRALAAGYSEPRTNLVRRHVSHPR